LNTHRASTYDKFLGKIRRVKGTSQSRPTGRPQHRGSSEGSGEHPLRNQSCVKSGSRLRPATQTGERLVRACLETEKLALRENDSRRQPKGHQNLPSDDAYSGGGLRMIMNAGLQLPESSGKRPLGRKKMTCLLCKSSGKIPAAAPKKKDSLEPVALRKGKALGEGHKPPGGYLV